MVGVKFPFVGFSKDLEQSSRWEGVQGALNLGGGRGHTRRSHDRENTAPYFYTLRPLNSPQ